jgi:hypothetical protein
MTSVSENYRRILARIGEASDRSGRSPESVRLIGVTKRVPVGRIREAIDCGLDQIGENRIQEAEAKFPLLEGAPITRHFIGHLQSNKAGKALELFSCIQTIDSVALAGRLNRLATGSVRVMVQMRLGDEESKSGVPEHELSRVVDAVRSAEKLDLVGLMGIPPFLENPEKVRPFFRRLKQCATELDLAEVSMGMSHDFETAIEEGATMVRVGTALFGKPK